MASTPPNLRKAGTPPSRSPGEAEGEVVDLRLRLEESLERERRLIDRALRAEETLGDLQRGEHDLREQLDRYARFHRAVLTSKPWRLLQAVRRLLGREW